MSSDELRAAMNCETAKMLVSAVLDGETARTAALDDHLAGCGSCRAFEHSALAIRRELRLQTVDSSADVTNAVIAALDDRTTPGDAAGPDRRAPQVGGRLIAFAAALLVLATSGSFLVGRASAPTQEIVAVDSGLPGVTDVAPPAEFARPTEVAPSSALGPESDLTLLTVWMPGRLDSDLVSGLDDLAAIDAVVPVRRATLGMTASYDSRGEPVDALDDGWEIPLDVVAVDQVSYGALLDSRTIAELKPGEGLLGATSARLRGGLGPGSVIWVGDTGVEVIGVVDDELIGKAELVVGAETGTLMGVATVRYALLATEMRQADLEQRIAAITDEPFRLSNRRQSPTLRNSDAVLPQIDMKARFGEFALRSDETGIELDSDWFNANIVTTSLPLIGPITCHRAVVSALQPALAELEAGGFEDAIDSAGFDGCWNPRPIAGSDDISHHAWGAAVDLLDASAAARLDPAVVKTMERHGFTWGGDWLRPDPAHFEFVGTARR